MRKKSKRSGRTVKRSGRTVKRSGHTVKRWALVGLGFAVVVAALTQRGRGTYVEEAPSGQRPIEGVGTATA